MCASNDPPPPPRIVRNIFLPCSPIFEVDKFNSQPRLNWKEGNQDMLGLQWRARRRKYSTNGLVFPLRAKLKRNVFILRTCDQLVVLAVLIARL